MSFITAGMSASVMGRNPGVLVSCDNGTEPVSNMPARAIHAATVPTHSGKLVQPNSAVQSHARLKSRKLHINQLADIERAMPVAARANRLGDYNTGGVDSLPNSAAVNAARHLLDEHWRKAHGSQLLMDTEEVDLAHRRLPVVGIPGE